MKNGVFFSSFVNVPIFLELSILLFFQTNRPYLAFEYTYYSTPTSGRYIGLFQEVYHLL